MRYERYMRDIECRLTTFIGENIMGLADGTAWEKEFGHWDKAPVKEPRLVTDSMRLAGNEIAEHLMDAQIEQAFGPTKLGGGRDFNLENYPEKYRGLIKSYLEDSSFESVDAIYIAMERQRLEDNDSCM
jgi:hypothetical protein